jgi:hypothetical protein
MTSKEEQEEIDFALDVALDELDDDDEEAPLILKKNKLFTTAELPAIDNDAADSTAASTKSLSSKSQEGSNSKARLMTGHLEDEEQMMSNMMQQMLRLVQQGGDAQNEFLGQLMRDMQSHLGSEPLSFESTLRKEKIDARVGKLKEKESTLSYEGGVDQAISSLLEGMAKEKLNDEEVGKKQRASSRLPFPKRLKVYASELIASDLPVQKHQNSHRETTSCAAKDDQSPYYSNTKNVEFMIGTLSLEKGDGVDTASSSLSAQTPRPSQRLHPTSLAHRIGSLQLTSLFADQADQICRPSRRLNLISPRTSMVDLDKGLIEPTVESGISPDESDVTMQRTRPRRVSTLSQKSQLVKDSKTLPKPWRALLTRKWTRLMSLVFLFVTTVTIFFGTPTTNTQLFVDKNSVYVPGGGFSGFWFTLGRLRSIPDPETKNFYCYSAGCLGVVATLLNYTMEEMVFIASKAQSRWKQGDVDRFDVVETFLDDLLFGDRSNSTLCNLLSRLNIITTVKGKWLRLNAVIRKPESLENLYEMLLQTTWIPYATGRALWLKDHMDGAFTAAQHPKCEHDVGVAPNLDLMANVLNLNLGRDKADKFYNAGLALGL